jgi:hypothetical protein
MHISCPLLSHMSYMVIHIAFSIQIIYNTPAAALPAVAGSTVSPRGVLNNLALMIWVVIPLCASVAIRALSSAVTSTIDLRIFGGFIQFSLFIFNSGKCF